MILIFLVIIIIIIIKASNNDSSSHINSGYIYETEKHRYGRRGEQYAANIIKQVLQDDDLFFTNVPVSFEGKKAELDNVIVNKFGVFIIEVKNYKGSLSGSVEDYEWKKYKKDKYGNTFEKEVRNPIKQVKREVYILANYLKNNDANVWVDGYVFLVQNNSPVASNYILDDMDAINKAIHTYGKTHPDKETTDRITKLLSAE